MQIVKTEKSSKIGYRQKVIKESRMMVDADSKDREKFKDRVQIERDKRKQKQVECCI